MSNTTLLIIVLVAVAVLAVLLVAFFVFRRRQGQREQQERQERARQEYGPEYERLVEERGSEREAERERRERVEGEVRPLSEESLRGYEERWQRVERTFVDNPSSALDEADRVVEEILVERNFPTDSRQEATEGIGVMHPGVVEDFREAQRTYRGATGSEGGADLEEMRLAIQKYRSVYERLTER